ncbi:hypothetical protein [Cesiribacter andamanensis]|uniref:DUF4412 domain-containing protein n=1 Tax=Cesiribacter andamanensis AMV16 TaxID=1279009 RepID=M7N984_9BACT|nr:hypothetical protein [Cesiribacter andamanensis]EMR03807.1 hypothetical protein ADICEAN_01048 [Cesiribacter andamanensis AMV16]
MKTSIQLLSIPLLLLLSSLFLGAQQPEEGLLLTTHSLDTETRASRTHIYLSSEKVLLAVEGEQTALLFDAKKETLYLLDHKKKEFTRLSQGELENISKQIGLATAELQQQVKSLPAAQRRLLEQQLADAPVELQELAYTQKAAEIAVKHWTSSKWAGTASGRLRHELFMAPYAELEVDKKDLEALLRLSAYVQQHQFQLGRSLPAAMIQLAGNHPLQQAGLPVKSIAYDPEGKPLFTCTLESIEAIEMPAGSWDIPQGYKEKKFIAGLQ